MSILTQDQKRFLNIFSSELDLSKIFYLTGGTALAEFYIPYRYSDDLDFFSEQEVETQAILAFLAKHKKELKFTDIEYNNSFNRNMFFLNFKDYTLKTEFTYFPFEQIDKLKPLGNLAVDSAIDIAINKLFTIYQKPRSRDFTDLYMLQTKYGYSMSELIVKTRSKFDSKIDPIKLGSQFMKVNELLDYPKFIEPLDDRLWKQHFLKESLMLKNQIFE